MSDSVTIADQLILGAAMMAFCILLHGFALFGLQRIVGSGPVQRRMEELDAFSLRGLLITLLLIFALIMVHFAEIWAFAFVYDWIGAQENIEDALYFSLITYSTVGYSDTLLAQDWRLVAALESILGMIMLGWSTAFLIRTLGKLEGRLTDGD
jgi:hypothetical protein